MSNAHFNAWKNAAERAISAAQLEDRLEFSRLSMRKDDPGFLEIVVRGKKPSWAGVSVNIPGGGTWMPSETDIAKITEVIRDRADEVPE